MKHGERTNRVDPVLRVAAAIFGAVLCVAGVVFAVLILRISVLTAIHSECASDLWCESDVVRVLVAGGVAALGLGASVLAVAAGRGFIRYARGVPVVVGWYVLMAILAPGVAIVWFFALLISLGAQGSLP